jgi:AbrB family looped-hinge helix DNA binding protein
VESRIRSRGRVTVPVELREQLGLEPGTPVTFELREGEAVLRKGGAENPVDHVYGMLRLDAPVDTLVAAMRGRTARPARRRRGRRASSRA